MMCDEAFLPIFLLDLLLLINISFFFFSKFQNFAPLSRNFPPLNFPRCEKIHSTSQSRHWLMLISLNYFSLFAPLSLNLLRFLLFGRFSPLFPLRENPDTVFPSVPLTAQRPSRCLHLTSESDQLYG